MMRSSSANAQDGIGRAVCTTVGQCAQTWYGGHGNAFCTSGDAKRLGLCACV